MNAFCRLLSVIVGAEIAIAGVLLACRLNSTLPEPPPVDLYTDAITGRELRAAPNRFLFDGFFFDGATKWRTLGEMYMAAGFFAKSEACLGRAAQCTPRSAEIAVLYGDCLERLGMLEEAADEFRRATGLLSDPAPAWYRLGRIHLQLERPLEAALAFESAGDDHLASVYQRARLLIGSNRAAEARRLLDLIAEQAPNDLLVWRRRAEVAIALGEPTVASEALDAAERSAVTLQLDEAHAQLAAARGRYGIERLLQQALAENGQDRALRAQRCGQLIADGSRWWNRYPNLLEQAAEAYLEAGDAPQARQVLQKQIEELGMPTARAWELHGAVEFLDGSSTQAWQDWRRSEKMQPSTIDHRKLARIAEQESDVSGARHHLALATQFAALEAFRSNRLDEARSGLRRAVSLEPKLPAAWFYLAEIERVLGEKAAARSAYRRCLDQNPSHGRARARLELLDRD